LKPEAPAQSSKLEKKPGEHGFLVSDSHFKKSTFWTFGWTISFSLSKGVEITSKLVFAMQAMLIGSHYSILHLADTDGSGYMLFAHASSRYPFIVKLTR
jgi:hypothetical protein